MLKQGDRSSHDKINGCFFEKKLRQVPHSFCLNIRKRFLLQVSFKNQIIEHEVL